MNSEGDWGDKKLDSLVEPCMIMKYEKRQVGSLRSLLGRIVHVLVITIKHQILSSVALSSLNCFLKYSKGRETPSGN